LACAVWDYKQTGSVRQSVEFIYPLAGSLT
jgi:hypothetical protein